MEFHCKYALNQALCNTAPHICKVWLKYFDEDNYDKLHRLNAVCQVLC